MGKDYPTDSVLRRYPHVGDTKYVGKETKTELAETWYRLTTFYLGRHADVAKLLCNNIWGVGVDPRACNRRVYTVIAPGSYGVEAGGIPTSDDVLLPKGFDSSQV
jgi:hypothetical protein